MLTTFRRPGTESAFTPRAGMVQAWRTSVEEIKTWIGVLDGRTTSLSVSKRREIPVVISVFINESKSKAPKSEYSYDQYHWWPIVFKIRGFFSLSSER